MGLNKLWFQKKFGYKWSKKSWGPKKLMSKIFGPKTFWVQKDLVQTNFGSKRFWLGWGRGGGSKIELDKSTYQILLGLKPFKKFL